LIELYGLEKVQSDGIVIGYKSFQYTTSRPRRFIDLTFRIYIQL
jgi:hypothetical protein